MKTLCSLLLASASLVLSSLGYAQTQVTVEVTGLSPAKGQLGCALFANGTGFPRATQGARRTPWQAVSQSRMRCVFDQVTPGQYAVSVSQDMNHNLTLDSNWVGKPTEPWGVSVNLRPAFRAPTFEEAAFDVADAPIGLRVEVR